jgi:hypothetical protein
MFDQQTFTDVAITCGGTIAGVGYGREDSGQLSMERILAVGFGAAGFSMDGKVMWQEGWGTELYTVADVEQRALVSPSHDWRIFFSMPLRRLEYQRQGQGQWLLIGISENRTGNC